ncbi:MAG: rhomboid family intramembrane serine protease [Bdellovibrionales bacterium]
MKQTARYYMEWQGIDQSLMTEAELLGVSRSALASEYFQEALAVWQSKRDPLSFDGWKTEYNDLKNEAENDPARIFGLSHKNRNSLAWVTYQFVQYDLVHLLSNVLTLLLFAALAENLVGGILTGGIYLLGGLVGGAAHLWLGGFDNSLPLVGSSAAVASLIGFVAIGTLRQRIPFITMINIYGFMMRGHPHSSRWMEPLYLSPLWLLAYFLLNDISTLIATPLEVSTSVAHWSHVGGGLTGLLLGLAFKIGVKKEFFNSSFFSGSKPSS